MEEYQHLPQHHYPHIRNDIRSGDILLCSGSSVFSRLIQTVTGSPWSHVAFILRLDAIDRIMVLESVESIGVRTVPLSTYVRNYNASRRGYPGQLMLARHKHVRDHHVAKLSRSAVDRFGFPYGTQEIVKIAARLSLHSIGFGDHPSHIDPQTEYICSEYAHVCFESIGITIPFNRMGFIAPVDFIKCPEIIPYSFLQTESLPPSHPVSFGITDELKHSNLT